MLPKMHQQWGPAIQLFGASRLCLAANHVTGISIDQSRPSQNAARFPTMTCEASQLTYQAPLAYDEPRVRFRPGAGIWETDRDNPKWAIASV